MAVLVIDVGSSSVRALAIDEETLEVFPQTVARRDYQFNYEPEGAAEIDSDRLRLLVEACIDEVLAVVSSTSGDPKIAINAVGITTLAGNLLGVDRQHQPVTPLYTYADTRAAPYVDLLRDKIDVKVAYQRTGCPHHVAYHPAKLAWLRHEVFQQQFDQLQWIDFASYCYGRWFGREMPCTYSIASWSGLLDRQSLSWDSQWLDVLHLKLDALPVLADFDTVQRGLSEAYRKRWPGLAEVPFYLAIGDGAAANIGSGGIDPDRVVLTVGTTSALRRVSSAVWPVLPRGLWHYRVRANMHLIGGATTEGGSIFAWARKQWNLSEEREALEAALRKSIPDSHGLTVLPMLAGERSPGYAPDAVGTIHGLRLSTTALEIVQALLESVALRLSIISDLLIAPDEEVPIYVGGGAMQSSPFWAQIMANAFNRPLYLVDEPEVTARGLAALIINRLDIARNVQIKQHFEPHPEAVYILRAARERQTALYNRFYSAE
jgi:gluconokinase